MSSTPIFSLRVPEVFEALETSAKGLTNAEANTRLPLYGQNLLSKQEKTCFWEKLAREFARAPVVVLLIVGFVALLQRDGIVAGIIWGIVLSIQPCHTA
jgi:magnesium-transporting ATPase (P-type)